jgi:hypothetical protein
MGLEWTWDIGNYFTLERGLGVLAREEMES